MDADRWKRVDHLLEAALDLSPEERSAFLTEHCGDDEGLRSAVDKLIVSHQQAGSFIETPAMAVAARLVARETFEASADEQVGPYRIISLLGAGGMGKVYLAEDSRLARRVALKILPFPLLADADRVRRFEREARAASALNHPNIIAIYDIGQIESIHYIATEYAAGQTLRDRLKAGGMPLDEAVGIAIQIAEALVAAHAAGIIHRDIKPENIVLRDDGYVKVLDFGLAKLTAPQSESEALSVSLDTDSGVIAGTVKYMSPEQALGQKVDSRTDLWSLGVVFYEMLTGGAPFDGPTPASVFDAILNHKHAPFDAVGDLQIKTNSILDRALEKNQQLRYQTAADLRADLLRLRRALQPEESNLEGAVSRFRKPEASPFGLQTKALAGAGAVVLLILAMWLIFKKDDRLNRPSGPDWTKAKSVQLTNGAGAELFADLNPDGRSFIYVSRASGNWDIYWQRVGGKNPVNLTKDSDADDTEPSYSPDGNYIAFRSEREPKGIYVMEATSENVRRVSDTGYDPSWSPDGKELVVSRASSQPVARNIIPSEVWIIDVATGAKRLLISGDAVQPSWSPNGHRIAYWGLRSGGGQRDIWTIPAQGGEPLPIMNDQALDWSPSWSPDGTYLYFASDRSGSMNFWRVPIDERTGQTAGEFEPVPTPSGYSERISFSTDGQQMAYVQRAETQTLHRIAFDPINAKSTGSHEAIMQGTEYVTNPDLSPDNEWLTYSSQGSRQEDVFVIKRDGSSQRQLTNDRFNDRSPRWSPDGNRIAFYSDRSGRYEIWVVNVDGSGLQQLTFTDGASAVYPVWSPDGKQMVFKQRNLLPYIFDPTKSWAEQTPRQLNAPAEPKENFWPSSWSANGRQLAGAWTNAGKNSIHIYDLDSGTYEQLTTFGNNPVWLNDDKRLLFRFDGEIYFVDSETKKVRTVLSFAPHEIPSFCISKDNRAIFYTLRRTEADVWLLNLEEARK
jgi:Tol biopolymer transport system component/serine/threonine protein kinase